MENATQRRLAEELGISTALSYLYKFQYHARYHQVGSEWEMCSVYIGKSNDPVVVNPNEIAGWKYIKPNDLTRELAKSPERYSPWFKMEWERLMLEHVDDIKRL